MAFNIFQTATTTIPLANLDANFTLIGAADAAATLYPTVATTSVTYGAGTTNHIFNTSGNFRLGTSLAPAYTSILRVQGGIESYGSQLNVVPGASTTFDFINRSSGGGFTFYTDANTSAAKLVLTSGGNLGVYNTSPQTALTVGSVTAGTGEATSKGLIQIQSDGGTSATSGAGLEFKAASASNGSGFQISCPNISSTDMPLVFCSRSQSATWTERLRIDLSGKIKPKGNIVSRISSTTVYSSWDSSTTDQLNISAQTGTATILADTNTTPDDGQKFIFRIVGGTGGCTVVFSTGSARQFRSINLLATTIAVNASQTLYVGCIYNSAISRWDIVAEGLS